MRKAPPQRQARGTNPPEAGLPAASSFIGAVHHTGDAGIVAARLAGRGRPAFSFVSRSNRTGRRRKDSATKRILEAYQQHPEWSGPQIAAHVGCTKHHVRRVLSDHGVSLRGFEALGRAAKAAGFNLSQLRQIAATMREAAE